MSQLVLEKPGAVASEVYRVDSFGIQEDILSLKGPWEDTFTKLNDLYQLKDNWDGEGAKAPSWTLVNSAIALARGLRRKGTAAPSRMVVSCDGTILLEWQSGSAYYEVEVVSPNRLETMLVLAGQRPRHETIVNWSGIP